MRRRADGLRTAMVVRTVDGWGSMEHLGPAPYVRLAPALQSITAASSADGDAGHITAAAGPVRRRPTANSRGRSPPPTLISRQPLICCKPPTTPLIPLHRHRHRRCRRQRRLFQKQTEHTSFFPGSLLPSSTDMLVYGSFARLSVDRKSRPAVDRLSPHQLVAAFFHPVRPP